MRLIGTLASQDDALTFTDYLITIGMPAHADEGRDGAWQVWIVRDDDLARLQRLREHAFDRLRQKRGVVVGGDEDGEDHDGIHPRCRMRFQAMTSVLRTPTRRRWYQKAPAMFR